MMPKVDIQPVCHATVNTKIEELWTMARAPRRMECDAERARVVNGAHRNFHF